MRDISARELKGHNILAVERFRDNTRWMIEFSILRPVSYTHLDAVSCQHSAGNQVHPLNSSLVFSYPTTHRKKQPRPQMCIRDSSEAALVPLLGTGRDRTVPGDGFQPVCARWT